MARLGRINKIDLWYATYEQGGDIVYETDKDGNIRYMTIDGQQTPIIKKKTPPHYSKPKRFKGVVSNSGGESEAVEFGVDISSYSAILQTEKDSYPFDELTLIWRMKEPKTDGNGYAIKSSADYRVSKVSKSLNYDRYLLTKMVNP